MIPQKKSNICDLCKGAGNLFRIWYGKCEWMVCPVCRGRGVLVEEV